MLTLRKNEFLVIRFENLCYSVPQKGTGELREHIQFINLNLIH